FSALRPRTITVSGITDSRGNSLETVVRPVLSTLTQGVTLRGRVVRLDGSPAANVPVTLTMNDRAGDGCFVTDVRLAQIFSDSNGYFDFDFILAGVGYTVAAADTSGLSEDTVRLILEAARNGQIPHEQLLALTSSPEVQNSLFAEFSVGNLPSAIAAVEGLDRAVLRD